MTDFNPEEIDFGGDDVDFTAAVETDNADIAAIFPEPLPADDPTKSFFSQPSTSSKSNQENQENPKTTNNKSLHEKEEDPNPNPNPNDDDDDDDAKDKTKKKKKKKGKKKKGGQNEKSDKEDGKSQVGDQRSKLREKLRNRMAMQKEVGGRGMQLMNQVGMTLDEVTQEGGNNMSRSKQDQIMNRTKGMLGNAFKNLDSKQKNVLSKKTDEVADMASNLMKKLLSGPGSKGASSTATKKSSKKTKKESTAKSTKSSGASLLDDDDDDDPEQPTLSSTFDHEIDEIARAVHEKPNKPSKIKSKPKSTSKSNSESDPTSNPSSELPLRPRHRDTKGTNTFSASVTVPATTSASASTSATNAEVTKKQKKYRKKREKIKQLLKAKNSNLPSSSLVANTNSKTSVGDEVPQLIPASVSLKRETPNSIHDSSSAVATPLETGWKNFDINTISKPQESVVIFSQRENGTSGASSL
jgi:hypothetical protein